jgi:transcriptional regulator with XRE-family HTH domain
LRRPGKSCEAFDRAFACGVVHLVCIRSLAGGEREQGDVNVVKEVGKKIRLLRTSRVGPRMTQEELADKAEISVSFLSMIERGERAPHLETLAKLAGALQVPITELFSFDSDPDKLEALYRPLVEFCRRQTMTRRDIDRLLAVAKSVFGT